jgi:hypothetical protein
VLPLALAGAVLLALAGTGAALLAGRGDDTPAADGARRETVTRQVTVARGPTTVVETVTGAAAPPPAPGPRDAASPEQGADLNDQAFGLMQEGRWEEALPLLERAVRALKGTYSAGFPYEAYAEYNLGRTHEALGDCKRARGHLRRSERLQGERDEITAALERCAGGRDDDD